MSTRWYFDFISPFAWLQWPRIRELAAHEPIEFCPLLFAGLLAHHGQKGPAEIPAKRDFTYRYVLWKATTLGMPLRFPPAHPFNPLAALRLCTHAGRSTEAIDAIFRHLWEHGRAGDTADSLAPVAAQLGLSAQAAQADADAKALLRRNFDAALAEGVFGVPTLATEGQVFWGEDATAMYLAWRAGAELFASDAMRALATLPVAAMRTP